MYMPLSAHTHFIWQIDLYAINILIPYFCVEKHIESQVVEQGRLFYIVFEFANRLHQKLLLMLRA
jgi:hypothetical protein